MEQMSARPCFSEVSQILTILRLFLINTLLTKKTFKFAQINYHMFQKHRPKYVTAKVNVLEQ